MAVKTEIPGIYKESEGVLVNKDNDALQKYRTKRQLLWQKETRLNTLESKVDSMDKKLEEITSLLIKLTKE